MCSKDLWQVWAWSGRLLGGCGQAFGRFWQGPGRLLSALRGSHGSFLVLQLLIAFCCLWGLGRICIVCQALLSFAGLVELCWAFLGFAELR